MSDKNIIFGYVDQFWTQYSDNRKFFRTRFSEAHDPHIHYVKYFDENLAAFLTSFIQNGHMENTILFMVSDHGAHNGVHDSFLYPDNALNPENSLPLLMTLVSKTLKQEYRDILASNEQSFTTHYDFYSALRTIAEGKIANTQYAESYSFIAEEMPENRDCNNSTMFLAQ